MRDRKLAEMMGMCWHVCNEKGRCSKCDMGLAVPMGSTIPLIKNPDFSLPEWLAKLMDFCVEQEWWEGFYRKTWREWYRKQDAWSVSREAKYVVHLWRNLPDLVYEYRGEHEY